MREKANNLILGAIYINANTDQPCRLVNIVSCQGVWLESYDGQGYGDLVEFKDCHYADIDEVNDYLEDYRVYNASKSDRQLLIDAYGTDECAKAYGKEIKAPSHKEMPEREYAYGKEIVRDSDGSAVIGWYDDNEGNDIRCRD